MGLCLSDSDGLPEGWHAEVRSSSFYVTPPDGHLFTYGPDQVAEFLTGDITVLRQLLDVVERHASPEPEQRER